MPVPRILPQRALLSMRDALFDKQRTMLEADITAEVHYTIDDVQRAIEWVDHELRKRTFLKEG